MTSFNSLIGKWKLVRDGSDFLPGLDSLNDVPLVLKLLGSSDIEFFKIEKKKYLDVEEIQFSYSAKNLAASRSYQFGTINYEQINGNDVTFASIQNCDESFRELTIHRLGPRTGQNRYTRYLLPSSKISICFDKYSREIYRLDASKDVIKLNVEMTTAEGTSIKLIKFLARFDASITENIPFRLAARSNGWKLYDFWPSTVLSSVRTQIVKVVKVKSQDTNKREQPRITETPWQRAREEPAEFNLATIPRSFGNKSTENDDFVEFIIKVTTDEATWFIARRYNEFDALRHFLFTQNPHNTEFQKQDSRFPGKAVLFRKSIMEARIRGLEEFLACYTENARFCRQNALDAMCAFLQVPEHLHAVSKIPGPGMQTTLLLPPSAVVAAASTTAASVLPVAAPVAPPALAATETMIRGASLLPPATAPSTSSQPRALTVDTSPAAVNSASAVQKAAVAAAAPAPTSTASSVATSPPAHPTVAAIVGDDENATLSPAQRRLLDALGEGLAVIKHGRQGAPKARRLRCNRKVTELFFLADDHRKTVNLSEVSEIRLGTEIDGSVMPKAVTASTSKDTDDNKPITPKRQSLAKRASLSFSSFSKNNIAYGTAILRRTCKAEDMHLCISLIMPDRTFDIQCQNEDDVNLLYSTLTEVCNLGNKDVASET